jgi:hypothetical protein
VGARRVAADVGSSPGGMPKSGASVGAANRRVSEADDGRVGADSRLARDVQVQHDANNSVQKGKTGATGGNGSGDGRATTGRRYGKKTAKTPEQVCTDDSGVCLHCI